MKSDFGKSEIGLWTKVESVVGKVLPVFCDQSSLQASFGCRSKVALFAVLSHTMNGQPFQPLVIMTHGIRNNEEDFLALCGMGSPLLPTFFRRIRLLFTDKMLLILP